MLLLQPNPKQVRNDVFKRILGGVQNSKSIHNIASQIVDELSHDLVLVSDPIERRKVIRDTYSRIENAHKLRRFHYNYASAEKNQSVSLAINEVLYRFKRRYAKYF